MLYIMLWEKWIDETYISSYTDGFNALRDLVKDFTPKAVSEICGIREKDLYEAARLFASSPAAAIDVLPRP
jgi:assimilatory nitrate reductase catalytic subunit